MGLSKLEKYYCTLLLNAVTTYTVYFENNLKETNGNIFPRKKVCVDSTFIPILALFGDSMWSPIIMCNFYVSFNNLNVKQW